MKSENINDQHDHRPQAQSSSDSVEDRGLKPLVSDTHRRRRTTSRSPWSTKVPTKSALSAENRIVMAIVWFDWLAATSSTQSVGTVGVTHAPIDVVHIAVEPESASQCGDIWAPALTLS